MSIKVASAVWEHSEQSGAALLMMLALADHANDAGYCWPSIKMLAHKARISERHAKRIIKQLIDDGEIVADVGGGRGRTTMYRVILGNGDTGDTFSEKRVTSDAERVTSDAERVTPVSEKGDTAMSPEPSLTIKEPSRNRHFGKTNLPPHLHNAQLPKAWDEWLQYHEERGKPITTATALRQFKDFEQMGPERAAAAIENSIRNNYTGLVEPRTNDNGQVAEPKGFAAIRKIQEEVASGNA